MEYEVDYLHGKGDLVNFIYRREDAGLANGDGDKLFFSSRIILSETWNYERSLLVEHKSSQRATTDSSTTSRIVLTSSVRSNMGQEQTELFKPHVKLK